jgi:hypothetical protein
VELWDTLKMARQTFGKDEDYKQFCSENGYVQKNGYPRFTAEILYKYISGNNEFKEEHTGLADVLIEKEIFTACMAKNSDCEKGVWS